MLGPEERRARSSPELQPRAPFSSFINPTAISTSSAARPPRAQLFLLPFVSIVSDFKRETQPPAAIFHFRLFTAPAGTARKISLLIISTTRFNPEARARAKFARARDPRLVKTKLPGFGRVSAGARLLLRARAEKGGRCILTLISFVTGLLLLLLLRSYRFFSLPRSPRPANISVRLFIKAIKECYFTSQLTSKGSERPNRFNNSSTHASAHVYMYEPAARARAHAGK